LGYRDPLAVMDPEARKRKSITDAIAEPTPDEVAERKKARTPEQHAEVDRKMEERYTAAKEALAKQGIDLDDIDSIVADRKKSMVVLDHLRASGKFSSMWHTSTGGTRFFPGLTTHVTNIVGNAAFGAWNLGPERLAEAFRQSIFRSKQERRVIRGVQVSIRWHASRRDAWPKKRPHVMVAGNFSTAEELGREGAFKVDGPRGAIKGKMGRLVRRWAIDRSWLLMSLPRASWSQWKSGRTLTAMARDWAYWRGTTSPSSSSRPMTLVRCLMVAGVRQGGRVDFPGPQRSG
jgi:hypothetical protein